MLIPTDILARTPTLLSVNVGRPAEHAWSGGVVRTAIWKRPVTGPCRVGTLNVDGDDQADRRGHGGEHRAVLVYQLESYDFWQQHFGRNDFEWGQFGENFTVTGLRDDDVHIGDRYRIGTAVFEVTQPRVTCYRVGVRLGEPAMAALLVKHRRPGFYLRVIAEGVVEAGDEIVHVSRPPDSLSVTDVDALLYLSHDDRRSLEQATRITALSQGWRRSLQDLLATTADTDDPAPGWAGFQPLAVVDIHDETADVRSIVLAPRSSTSLPVPKAGQYLTIRLGTDDASSLIRNYSISSAPNDGTYRISVKRDDHGAASQWIHRTLATGSTLDAAVPRGDFTLHAGSTPVLLASAGIGVTPLLAMLHELATTQDPRPVVWLHTARSSELHPFAEETRRLVECLPNGTAEIYYTADESLGTLPAAVGHTTQRVHHGRPDPAALRTLGLPTDTDAYVCGPTSFMTAITTALRDVGIDADHIHTEAFGASAVTDGKAPPAHAPAGEPGTGPTVTFSRSGLTVPFSSTYTSLLELAEACDVPTSWSCRAGVCQTCTTPMIAGSVRYAPQPLQAPIAGTVLLCCATPTLDVVLDA